MGRTEQRNAALLVGLIRAYSANTGVCASAVRVGSTVRILRGLDEWEVHSSAEDNEFIWRRNRGGPTAGGSAGLLREVLT